MKKFICSVDCSIKGCQLTINEDELKINLFFHEIIKIPLINIKSIILYEKSLFLKIVYTGNIKNNEDIIDVSIVGKNKFINYANSLNIPIEKRVKFVKGRIY